MYLSLQSKLVIEFHFFRFSSAWNIILRTYGKFVISLRTKSKAGYIYIYIYVYIYNFFIPLEYSALSHHRLATHSYHIAQLRCSSPLPRSFRLWCAKLLIILQHNLHITLTITLFPHTHHSTHTFTAQDKESDSQPLLL